MSNEPGSWTDLKWIEPESRMLMKSVFKRNMDVMTDSARRSVNWGVLAFDVVAVVILLRLL